VDAGEEVSAPTSAAAGSRLWLRVVLWGLVYAVIGLATAALARDAATGQVRLLWRWTAWLLSAVVFAAQILPERSRGQSPAWVAWRAALAVAMGGFLLAVAATVHSMSAGAGRLAAHLVALVAWPVLLAVPAFLVAWAAATALGRKGA
jgi:hypothetical protein